METFVNGKTVMKWPECVPVGHIDENGNQVITVKENQIKKSRCTGVTTPLMDFWGKKVINSDDLEK